MENTDLVEDKKELLFSVVHGRQPNKGWEYI